MLAKRIVGLLALRGALVFGALTGAGVAGAAGATARPDPYPLLPGRVVGLIVLPGSEPWGSFYEPGFDWGWAGSEEDTTYRFLVGERTEYAPYFSPVEPLRNPFALHIELPDGRTTHTVDMARGAKALAAKAHGVLGAVHLVEVEVNGGRGGRGAHFIVTKTRMLEGTSAFPFVLADELANARGAFDAVVASSAAAIEKELGFAERKTRAAAGARFLRPHSMDVHQVVYRPVWLEGPKRVEVFFAYRHTKAIIVKSGPPKPYTKHAPPPPELTSRYSAGMAVRYRIGAASPVEVKSFGPMPLEPSIPFHHVPWDPDGLP